MKLIEIYKGDGGHFDKTYHFPKLKKSFAELKRYLQCPQQPPFFWANMLSLGGCVPTPNMDPSNSRMLLLMEEILHHLRCIKPCKERDIYHINWCRISSTVSWEICWWIGQQTTWLDWWLVNDEPAGLFQLQLLNNSNLDVIPAVWQPLLPTEACGVSVEYDATEGPRFGATPRFRSSPFGGRFWRKKIRGVFKSFL